MKRLVYVYFVVFSGVVSAQSVDWNRAWSGCTAEAREFDAEAPGSGTNSQKVKEWVESNTGSPSTNVAGLQRKLEEDRGLLSDRNEALLVRLSAKLAICGSTAALNQLQRGSTTQSASPAPTSGRNMPEKYASHCISYVPSDPGAVRNTCNESVNLRWCSLNNNSNNRCGNNNLGWAEMAPGATTYVDANVKSYVFGCFAPAHPSEVEYTPGRGLQAYCKQ